MLTSSSPASNNHGSGIPKSNVSKAIRWTDPQLTIGARSASMQSLCSVPHWIAPANTVNHSGSVCYYDATATTLLHARRHLLSALDFMYLGLFSHSGFTVELNRLIFDKFSGPLGLVRFPSTLCHVSPLFLEQGSRPHHTSDSFTPDDLTCRIYAPHQEGMWHTSSNSLLHAEPQKI